MSLDTASALTAPRLALDEARLLAYLRSSPAFSGVPLGSLRVQQFKHGQSNPTYLLELGGQRLVLRKQPPGKLLASAHAVDREYRVLKAMADHSTVPVPRPLVLCTYSSVIGTPFYVMEFAGGLHVLLHTILQGVVKHRILQNCVCSYRVCTSAPACTPHTTCRCGIRACPQLAAFLSQQTCQMPQPSSALQPEPSWHTPWQPSTRCHPTAAAVHITTCTAPALLKWSVNDLILRVWSHCHCFPTAGRIFVDPNMPDATPQQRSAAYTQLAQTLAALHKVSPSAAGLEGYGNPTSYCRRQLSRWAVQYVASVAQPMPEVGDGC